MIQGRENITSWLRRNGPFWKLYRGTSESTGINIENSRQEGTYTENQSQEDFNLILRALSPGAYFVKASKADSLGKPNFSKGYQAVPFEILSHESYHNNQPQQQQLQQQASIGSIPEITEKIRAEIMRDLEFKAMKEELAQLRKEREEPTQLEAAIGAIAEMLKPYVPALAGKFLGPQAALVSGVQSAPAQPYTQTNITTQNTESVMNGDTTKPVDEMDQQELFHHAWNKIETAYANYQNNGFVKKDVAFVDYFHKLALIAEKEPQTFIMLIGMLDQKEIN